MKENKPVTVLLVDDNRPLLVTLGDFLSFEGFRLVLAESGEEALSRIEEEKPDLIVLDISMPGMGGIGFLRRISQPDGKLRYPVLVLTARAEMEEYFGNVAVDGFLAKPCGEQELLEKIREILKIREKREGEVSAAGRIRILLAEDDPLLAQRINHVFSSDGFCDELILASNGPDVLERSVENPPDLFMIKQILHGMNGSAVISLLGMIQKTKFIPTILYSQDHALGMEKDSLIRGIRKGVKVLPSADPWKLLQTAKDILPAGKAAPPAAQP